MIYPFLLGYVHAPYLVKTLKLPENASACPNVFISDGTHFVGQATLIFWQTGIKISNFSVISMLLFSYVESNTYRVRSAV